MSLPLLTAPELISPMSQGLISSTTANLMAMEGKLQADNIEKVSQQTEAAGKAPAITALYTSAYQKIADGDLTGFADMQQARGLAGSNPILMSTVDSADKLAGTLANIQKYQQMTKYQMDKTALVQGAISDRAAASVTAHDARTDETAAKSLYVNAHDAWERENFNGQKQYEQEMKSWESNQAAQDARDAALGTKSAPLPKPQPYQARPEPKVEDYLQRMGPHAPAMPQGNGADTGSPLFSGSDPTDGNIGMPTQSGPIAPQAPAAPNPNPPTAPQGATQFQNNPMIPLQTIGANPDPRIVMDVSSQLDKPTSSPQPPVTVPPIHEQVQSQVEAGKQPSGVIFGYDPKVGTALHVTINPQPTGTVKSMDTEQSPSGGSVKTHIEMNGDAKEAVRLLGELDDRENLSKWISTQLTFQGMGGGKVEAFPIDPTKPQGACGFRTGSSTFQQKDSTGQNKTVEYSAQVGEDWEKLKGLVRQGVATITPAPMADLHKDQIKDKLVSQAAQNPDKFDLDGANAGLKQLGIPAITPEDIQSKISDIKKPALDAATEEYQRRVDSDLASRNIFPAGTKPTDQQNQQDSEASSSQLDDLGKQIGDTEKELNKYSGTLSTQDTEKARQLSDKLIQLKDKWKQVYTKYARSSDLMMGP